jgi:hypothetical protein
MFSLLRKKRKIEGEQQGRVGGQWWRGLITYVYMWEGWYSDTDRWKWRGVDGQWVSNIYY